MLNAIPTTALQVYAKATARAVMDARIGMETVSA